MVDILDFCGSYELMTMVILVVLVLQVFLFGGLHCLMDGDDAKPGRSSRVPSTLVEEEESSGLLSVGKEECC